MLMTRQRHRVEDLNVITNPYNIYPLINIYNIMGEKLLPNFGAKISALIYYFTYACDVNVLHFPLLRWRLSFKML